MPDQVNPTPEKSDLEKSGEDNLKALQSLAKRGGEIVTQLEALSTSIDGLMKSVVDQLQEAKGSTKRKFAPMKSLMAQIYTYVNLLEENQQLTNMAFHNRLSATEDLLHLTIGLIKDEFESSLPEFDAKLRAKALKLLQARREAASKKAETNSSKTLEDAVNAAKGNQEENKPKIIQLPT
jgi:hypothetical protein